MGMIFRAAVSIALVAILMPHEPDLGYGRPNDSNSFAAAIRRDFQVKLVAMGDEIRHARVSRHEDGNVIVAAAESLTKLTAHRAGTVAGPIGGKLAETVKDKASGLIGAKIDKFTFKADDPLP
jgi:hypothetical protein